MPGARADVAVFPADDVEDMPDPLAALVMGPDRYAAHVLVDGRFVVRDGNLVGVDLREAHGELRDRAVRLWQ